MAYSGNASRRSRHTLASIKQNATAEEKQWIDKKVEEHGEAWLLNNWPALEHQLEYIRSL